MDQDSDYSYEENEGVAHSSSEGEGENKDDGVNMSRTIGEPSRDQSEHSSSETSSGSESEPLRSPLKRPAEDSTSHRPFKRQRGELNYNYLELLNKDIEDAANRTSFGDMDDLPASQIGLTFWSSSEKRKFFEALARLGKQNLQGIATKVGSKSVVEVSHYLNLLHDAQTLRRKLPVRPPLEPAEYPAAVEFSQPCCYAQEEAADEISLKQEVREEEREQHHWRSLWDVTPKVARKISRDIRDANNAHLPAFAQFFHVSTWLELSERMFMNSSIPGNNWVFIEDDPPSMWATTFEDFHSLAVSLTRRLVQTTLFMAMSRIRSKSATGDKIRDRVRLQDAEAAIVSLGLVPRKGDMWIKSARRLRLEVYEEPPDGDGENDSDPMAYDEVEQELSGKIVPGSPNVQPDLDRLAISDEEYGSSTDDDSSRSPSPVDEEAKEINKEADEIFEYSAMGIRTDRVAGEALKLRIAMDRQKERHADECDEFASYKAELEMWTTLQKKPPMELPKKHDPGPPKRSNLNVEGIYPGGREWMHKLQYYSEWETKPEPDEDEMTEG